jgi:hypothetical protein
MIFNSFCHDRGFHQKKNENNLLLFPDHRLGFSENIPRPRAEAIKGTTRCKGKEENLRLYANFFLWSHKSRI